MSIAETGAEIRRHVEHITRLRADLSDLYGDESVSRHTCWCLNFCWPGEIGPRRADGEVPDWVLVAEHPDCICGYTAPNTENRQ